jgi:hypothetical protein
MVVDHDFARTRNLQDGRHSAAIAARENADLVDQAVHHRAEREHLVAAGIDDRRAQGLCGGPRESFLSRTHAPSISKTPGPRAARPPAQAPHSE